MALINLEINLNKVFENSIIEKNGKKYVCITDLQGSHIYQNPNKGTTNLKLVVADRKEPSQYGQTHTVSLSKPKDQTEKVYVGDGKEYKFNNNPVNNSQTAADNNGNNDVVDDLPF